MDFSVCDQSQCRRVRLVGIGERGLFHILKDNIITWLRLREKYCRGSMALRQRDKARSHHPTDWLVGTLLSPTPAPDTIQTE